MKIHNILKVSIAVTAMTAMSSAVSAKDWIEKVEIVKDGIDLTEIEVETDGGNYTGIKTKTHRFALAIKVNAKSGKRIWGAVVEAGTVSEYFEAANPAFWRHKLHHNAVGAGNNRTLNMQMSPFIGLDTVRWAGLLNPVQLCQSNLQNRMKKGQSKASVLSQDWELSARAVFAMQALVARPAVAKKGPDINKPHDSQRSSVVYPVRLRCLASKNIINSPDSIAKPKRVSDADKPAGAINSRKPVRTAPRVSKVRSRIGS